jgi:hypothetical protein
MKDGTPAWPSSFAARRIASISSTILEIIGTLDHLVLNLSSSKIATNVIIGHCSYTGTLHKFRILFSYFGSKPFIRITCCKKAYLILSFSKPILNIISFIFFAEVHDKIWQSSILCSTTTPYKMWQWDIKYRLSRSIHHMGNYCNVIST